MLFPTVEFAIFFAIVFFVSWGIKDRPLWRKIFLISASYFFYAYWDHRFVLLLIEASIVNYLLGLWLAKDLGPRTRKLLLGTGVAFNLFVLALFKYSGFFMANFLDMLSAMGLAREAQIWEIILPMGISFFTFQGISYVIDVYRREIEARRSLVDVLLYISFFPQLVAGPIVRAKEFIPQLDEDGDEGGIRMSYAFLLIGMGLFKKMVIAHYVAVTLVEPVFNSPEAYGTIDLLFGVYGFAVQIYCDFSAYSDMAIGFAALLGFSFSKNFDQPYRAKSITEFWRRWHISLSSWLRDYLYIPLGGSRGSLWITCRNLMITMLLGGLWHGAAWNFVVWGALHGGALVVERLFRSRNLAFTFSGHEKVFLTFHFVCFTWIFFRVADFQSGIDFLSAFAFFQTAPQLVNGFTISLVILGMVGHFLPPNLPERVESLVKHVPISVQGIAMGFLIVLLSAVGPGMLAPFIYFRF